MSRYTAFRCPEELLSQARYIASSERRSLSNYIIRLIEQDWLQRSAIDGNYEEEAKEATGKHLHAGLRIPPELRERAKQQAKTQGRSLSNYIKFLISQDLDRVAKDPPKPGKD
ncbi:hypothetical protein BH20VER3_BH20VER3_00830 [soil metagenome]